MRPDEKEIGVKREREGNAPGWMVSKIFFLGLSWGSGSSSDTRKKARVSIQITGCELSLVDFGEIRLASVLVTIEVYARSGD